MTILKDIAWRIVSTSPFDPIRPRICHSNMYRLIGKTKRSKHELSTIVFGRRETSEYFSKLVYLDEPMPEFLGRRNFSNIPSFLEDAAEDVVIVETDWSFLGFLRDNGFLVLPQINFALDITGSWETIQGRMARSKVRRMSGVVEAGYTFEITKDLEKLRSFYHEMYLPHMYAKHGKSALPVSYLECKRLFLGGCLMLVKRGQEYAAGIILVPQGDELYEPLIAVKGNRKQMTLGSYAATYYTIVFGMKEGYSRVNFGNAPPFMHDGLFQYKKEWGMQIRPLKGSGSQVLGMRLFGKSKALMDFLSENPFVFVQGDSLKGVFLLDPADRRLPNVSNIVGLSSFFVISSSYLGSNYPQLEESYAEKHSFQSKMSLRDFAPFLNENEWEIQELSLKT
jgi:hypothetical protein